MIEGGLQPSVRETEGSNGTNSSLCQRAWSVVAEYKQGLGFEKIQNGGDIGQDVPNSLKTDLFTVHYQSTTIHYHLMLMHTHDVIS